MNKDDIKYYKTLNNAQKTLVLVLGIGIAFAIIYFVWAIAIYLLAWAFKFEFYWSYPIGGIILSTILTMIFKNGRIR